jgi:Fic family protein
VIEIHRRFCELLPEDFLWIDDPNTGERIRVIPGEFRERDVIVGQHVAISPGALARFMQRYENVYSNLNRHHSIVAAAAAHHRLLWIHPFLDGNGRVARLLSYASLSDSLGSGGIWSVARGLARIKTEYKNHLMDCDSPRRGDNDGRGPRSEQSLASFTRFFLETSLDQVKFMRGLVRPDLLRTRILIWAKEEIHAQRLPPRSVVVLDTLLSVGELPRGDIQSMLDVSPATARRIIASLTEQGIVVSETTRAPLKLAFPASLASRWFPGLFPDR